MVLTPVNEPTNLWLKQGAAFRTELIYKDENGELFNNTDYHAYMQARIDVDTPPLINLTDSNGGIAMGGTNGVLQLYAGASVTSLISHDLVYDLFIMRKTDTDDSICVFFGKIDVEPAVTVLP